MGRPVLRGDRRQRAVHGYGRPDFQLRADPQLKAELDYCVPLGIPHSGFLSWPETDRGYALAWTQNKAETCPGCGTRHDEWDPAQGGSKDAYVADQHHCYGCAVLAMERDALPKSNDGQLIPGHSAFLVPAELYDLLHPPDDDTE